MQSRCDRCHDFRLFTSKSLQFNLFFSNSNHDMRSYLIFALSFALTLLILSYQIPFIFSFHSFIFHFLRSFKRWKNGLLEDLSTAQDWFPKSPSIDPPTPPKAEEATGCNPL